MNKATMKAYASAIANAALSRKAALQLELAVSFAVFLDQQKVSRLAKSLILEVYAEAGYKCREIGEVDWKAVNRRVNASGVLFEMVGMKDVMAWSDGKTRGALIQ